MSSVTVIIATYNGEKYIKEQLDSIICQSFQDFTILICDDCSDDNTMSILLEYEKEYPQKIKILSNNENVGFLKNFEKLIKYSEGDYIAFSDQDDIWTENHLELLLSYIGTNDAICANSDLVDENGNSMLVTMKDVLKIQDNISGEYRILTRLMHENFSQGSTMLVRSSFVKDLIPFPNGIKYHDYWIAIQAAIRNGICYNPTSILHYRQHGGNITRNFKSSIIRGVYNAKKGFIRKHSAYQYDLISLIDKKLLSEEENKIVNDALMFHKSIKDRKIDSKTKEYFKSNYEFIFLTKKGYWLRYFEYFWL